MLERLLQLCEKYPLDFVTYFSSSLPIIIALFRYKYLSLSAKLIVVYFIFFFVRESFSIYQSALKQNNLYLQNIEVIINTSILLAIAFSCIKSIYWKRFASILVVFISFVSIITYKVDEVSSTSLSLFRLFAIFFSLSYFNKILVDVRVKNILLHTLFWFITGLFIYATGTFFIMLFSEYWYKDINKVSAEIFDKYWNINQILFIFFSLLSSYGLWVSKYDRENFI